MNTICFLICRIGHLQIIFVFIFIPQENYLLQYAGPAEA